LTPREGTVEGAGVESATARGRQHASHHHTKFTSLS
jgi:hypothetical protein